MRKLILLFVITFTIPISAQVEKIYFKDGVTLKETGNLKNGFKDGKWEEFYENGKLKTTGNYTNDERNGEWKIYFDNGQLAAIGNYTSTKFPTPGTWKFFSKEGVEQEFNCPEPTIDNFSGICLDLFKRYESKGLSPVLSLSYQEKIWKISCANPEIDNLETAKTKIQMMWNRHRIFFRCYDYPVSIATDANIAKFSLDNGFSGLIIEFSRKYQLDMNFIDPKDNKTPLDFIFDQEKLIRKSPPVNTDKADEYQRVYKILRANGAKHSWELNK